MNWGAPGLPGEVSVTSGSASARRCWSRSSTAPCRRACRLRSRSGGTVIYAPSASQDVLTEVLKGTVNIPPTVIKRNGDRIQVLVARDVDFRPVYELHASAGR